MIVKETDKNRWKIYQNLEINLESLKRIFRESRKDLQRIPKNLGITSNILREFQRNLKRIFYEGKHSISIVLKQEMKETGTYLGENWESIDLWYWSGRQQPQLPFQMINVKKTGTLRNALHQVVIESVEVVVSIRFRHAVDETRRHGFAIERFIDNGSVSSVLLRTSSWIVLSLL